MPRKYGFAMLAVLLPMLGACAGGSPRPDAAADLLNPKGGVENNEGDRVAMGRLLLASDSARAARLFSAAAASSPPDPVALDDLGIALDLAGKHTDAQAAYRHALAVQPGLRAAQVNLALSLALDGNADRALDAIASLGTDAAASPIERADITAVHALAGR